MPQSQRRLAFTEVIDEAVRPPSCNRHRQVAILPSSNERDRPRRSPGMRRTLDQQSSREFASTIPTTRTCDASVPTDEHAAEIHLGACFVSQPLQPRASSTATPSRPAASLHGGVEESRKLMPVQVSLLARRFDQIDSAWQASECLPLDNSSNPSLHRRTLIGILVFAFRIGFG